MPLEKIKVHAAFDLLLLHMAGSSLMRYSSTPLLVGNIDLCLPMSLLSFNNYVMDGKEVSTCYEKNGRLL